MGRILGCGYDRLVNSDSVVDEAFHNQLQEYVQQKPFHKIRSKDTTSTSLVYKILDGSMDELCIIRFHTFMNSRRSYLGISAILVEIILPNGAVLFYVFWGGLFVPSILYPTNC